MRAGAVGVAVLLAATASGGIEQTILHGASVGRVRAWIGTDSVPGLTQELLQTVAESGLSKGGIRLNPGAEAEFFISATVVLGVPGACFVRLDARLVEEAKLERNGHVVDASSWSRGSDVASNTPDECAKLATKAAQDVVADFVEHYRAMNPVQASK